MEAFERDEATCSILAGMSGNPNVKSASSDTCRLMFVSSVIVAGSSVGWMTTVILNFLVNGAGGSGTSNAPMVGV
jgi:hypothetical protein